MTSFSHIAELYRSGGWVMHPILLIGVFILALGLERAWVIIRASSLNFGRLKTDIVKHVTRGDVSGAASLCKDVTSPVGQVARAILLSGGRTEDELYAAADAEATVVLPPITRRMNYFALFANVSTLLGLLGTIFGLITAFSAVGAADPSQRSSFLAKGISEAMNATAFGLMVAVPALLIHGFFLSRAERIGEKVDEMTVAIVRALKTGGSREGVAHSAAQGAPHATAHSGHSGASVGRPAAAPAQAAPQHAQYAGQPRVPSQPR